MFSHSIWKWSANTHTHTHRLWSTRCWTKGAITAGMSSIELCAKIHNRCSTQGRPIHKQFVGSQRSKAKTSYQTSQLQYVVIESKYHTNRFVQMISKILLQMHIDERDSSARLKSSAINAAILDKQTDWIFSFYFSIFYHFLFIFIFFYSFPSAGSEIDDEEMIVSESENSNDSWTTEEFSSEFIMRYGSRLITICWSFVMPKQGNYKR